MKKHIIILLLLTLSALWPFFKKGFFESHDGEWMVIRFSAFHQTLASGQFPVRFVDRLNNNYGYPVTNFLYPLPFYLAEVPKILGFNFTDSIKIIFASSTIISVVAMFWALQLVFARNAALAGAITYLFIPYRFVDLYVRGSIGENAAFAVAPLILGSIYKIQKGQFKFLPLLALFTAFLILSHNVIAILFIPVLFLIAMVVIKKQRLIVSGYFLLGILVSSFFLIPAIWDIQYVKLSQIKVSEISNHLVNLSQLIVPSWGYGPNPAIPGGMSVQVGVVSSFIFLAACLLRFLGEIKDRVFELSILIFLIVLFLMTQAALPFWQVVPFVDVIQFPWRLLALIVFSSSLLSAYLVNYAKNKILVATLIIVAVVTSTIIYTKPRSFVERGDGFYSTNEDSTTVRDEYLPLWVKEKPQQRDSKKLYVFNGQAEIVSSQIKSANYRATVNSQNDSTIRVNTIYFPGWQVKVNGQKVDIDHSNKFGLIDFKLPRGIHEVIISYTRMPVHLASELISLTSILLTGVLLYRLWQKRNS